MSAAAMDLCVNLAGLIGIALLSWPALYAAKLARLAMRLQAMSPLDDSPRAQTAHENAKAELERQRAGWGPGLNFCLLAGTGVTALSYAIGILKYFIYPG